MRWLGRRSLGKGTVVRCWAHNLGDVALVGCKVRRLRQWACSRMLPIGGWLLERNNQLGWMVIDDTGRGKFVGMVVVVLVVELVVRTEAHKTFKIVGRYRVKCDDWLMPCVEVDGGA